MALPSSDLGEDIQKFAHFWSKNCDLPIPISSITHKFKKRKRRKNVNRLEHRRKFGSKCLQILINFITFHDYRIKQRINPISRWIISLWQRWLSCKVHPGPRTRIFWKSNDHIMSRSNSTMTWNIVSLTWTRHHSVIGWQMCEWAKLSRIYSQFLVGCQITIWKTIWSVTLWVGVQWPWCIYLKVSIQIQWKYAVSSF